MTFWRISRVHKPNSFPLDLQSRVVPFPDHEQVGGRDYDGERQVELSVALAAHADDGELLPLDGVEADAVVARVSHRDGDAVTAHAHVLGLTQLRLAETSAVLGVCRGKDDRLFGFR